MRILCCWELGGGSGHLPVFGALAPLFRDRGHEVLLAARDVVAPRRFDATRDLPVLAAPRHDRNVRTARPAASYAELLLRCGYRDTEVLSALLGTWVDLLHTVRAELVVVDHAPTALLAARVMAIPAAVTGTGFVAPPAVTPMPSLLPWSEVGDHVLGKVEHEAVRCINAVLSMHDTPGIDRIAELFDPARVFPATYPELDHYGVRAAVRYYGTADERGRGAEPRWPRGRGERVFVYMHPNYPQFATTVRQLAASGHPTVVVAPGIGTARAARLSGDSLRVQAAHVDIDLALQGCRLVVCHGGHGTVTRVLRHGIAPIVVPHFVEQTLSAWRLGRQGLAFAAHPDPRRLDYPTMLRAALDGEIQQRAAAAFAQKHPLEGSAGAMRAMADGMLALV